MNTKESLQEELRKYRFEQSLREYRNVCFSLQNKREEARDGSIVWGAYSGAIALLACIIAETVRIPPSPTDNSIFAIGLSIATTLPILYGSALSHKSITTLRTQARDLEKKLEQYRE